MEIEFFFQGFILLSLGTVRVRSKTDWKRVGLDSGRGGPLVLQYLLDSSEAREPGPKGPGCAVSFCL